MFIINWVYSLSDLLQFVDYYGIIILQSVILLECKYINVCPDKYRAYFVYQQENSFIR